MYLASLDNPSKFREGVTHKLLIKMSGLLRVSERFLPSAPVILTQKVEDKYCFSEAKSSSVPELRRPGSHFVPAFAV